MLQEQAAAQAVAPETESTPEPTPDEQVDTALREAYSRAHKRDAEPEEQEEPAEASVEEEADAGEPEEEAEQPAAQLDIPTDLSSKWKAYWEKIPDEARQLVLDQTREANAKNSKLGSEVQALRGIKPIHDTLVDLAKENPALQDMSIPDIAAEMKTLVNLNASFNRNPVQAVLGLIQQHNLAPAVAQALQGQPVSQPSQQVAQLQQHIRALEGRLSKATDPEQQFETYENWRQTSDVRREVTQFSSEVEHWDDVATYLPQAIALVQARTPDAPAKDILGKAYRMAVRELKGINLDDDNGTAPAAPKHDPERAEAAKKAASVNVQGSTSGKARAMTEEEKLVSAYRKAQSK